ncbi:MAG: hypothetical protein JWN14_795 [Chthonomonadales bacterium]|nr:hypothetical protein [Chthonomonadales bacterium]
MNVWEGFPLMAEWRRQHTYRSEEITDLVYRYADAIYCEARSRDGTARPDAMMLASAMNCVARGGIAPLLKEIEQHADYFCNDRRAWLLAIRSFIVGGDAVPIDHRPRFRCTFFVRRQQDISKRVSVTVVDYLEWEIRAGDRHQARQDVHGKLTVLYGTQFGNLEINQI